VPVAEFLQHTRGSEAGEPGTASKAEQRVLNDVVEMMRGAKKLETEALTLFGEERIAGSTQVRLRSIPLLFPHSNYARHVEGGAQGRNETGIFRRSFAPHAVIKVQDAQFRSQGFVSPQRAKQVD
jgi:hypothetical protein